ncbi:hypothetical protein HY489_05540 [Candidatus Woesearchaeota archaeon]|nr:hypothetical protein [Candidatus Woesearchaeota archaeon]
MKKGQQSIGLVILGVVSIVAVIGLVLLFTRASKEAQGALLTDLSIGNSYSTVNPDGSPGIANTYETPTGPAAPEKQYAAPPGWAYQVSSTRGTRTPAFIVSARFSDGGYASIEDLYACETDLTVGPFVGVPHDQFNCYAVPNKGATSGEVKGFYPRASSAYERPPEDTVGKTGGDMYCYANSLGAEQQVPNSEQLIRQNIIRSLVENQPRSGLAHDWTTATVNGASVPVCWVSDRSFPFPQ